MILVSKKTGCDFQLLNIRILNCYGVNTTFNYPCINVCTQIFSYEL